MIRKRRGWVGSFLARVLNLRGELKFTMGLINGASELSMRHTGNPNEGIMQCPRRPLPTDRRISHLTKAPRLSTRTCFRQILSRIAGGDG